MRKVASKRVNPGRALESLVAAIQQSLHESAKITLNEKIVDVDSGEEREIDICIRLSDGPTEFLGIVEVRDQSRPVGSPYVEQVISKRSSVRADAAFIVARAGFSKPALIKCSKFGVRALTVTEAAEGNWSAWLGIRFMSGFERKFEASEIAFGYPGTETPIELSERVRDAVRTDPLTKLFTDEDGNGLASLQDLVQSLVNRFADQIYPNLAMDGTRIVRRLHISGGLEPSIYVEDISGSRVRVGPAAVVASFWWEENRSPISLLRYGKESGTPLAEVAQAEISIGSRRHRIEIIAPGARDVIPANTEVTIRVTDLGPKRAAGEPQTHTAVRVQDSKSTSRRRSK